MQTSSIFMKRGSHEQRNVTILRDGAGKKGALIGTSVEAPGTTYATGSMDVGVAPERSLTFSWPSPYPSNRKCAGVVRTLPSTSLGAGSVFRAGSVRRL